MKNKYIAKNLFELIQNPIVAAIAPHSFTVGYNNNAKLFNKQLLYPKIEYMFFVLPIVYNQRALNVFFNSYSVSRALEKDHTISLGLQERAIKMIRQTYEGLNIAFCKNILCINNSNMTIQLKYDNGRCIPLPQNATDCDLIKIQRAAKNLGGIFAKTNERNIQNNLNIRF